MNCEFKNNQEVIEKIKEKGFSNDKMPQIYNIECTCGEKFKMDTYLKECPNCNSVYGVTPCSADDIKNIVKIGKK